MIRGHRKRARVRREREMRREGFILIGEIIFFLVLIIGQYEEA